MSISIILLVSYLLGLWTHSAIVFYQQFKDRLDFVILQKTTPPQWVQIHNLQGLWISITAIERKELDYQYRLAKYSSDVLAVDSFIQRLKEYYSLI